MEVLDVRVNTKTLSWQGHLIDLSLHLFISQWRLDMKFESFNHEHTQMLYLNPNTARYEASQAQPLGLLMEQVQNFGAQASISMS